MWLEEMWGRFGLYLLASVLCEATLWPDSEPTVHVCVCVCVCVINGVPPSPHVIHINVLGVIKLGFIVSSLEHSECKTQKALWYVL